MNIDLNERVERARQLFKSGYNCAQSVVLAYADLLPVDREVLATVAAPFGGGMGRLREVCGAVSGMSIVAGFVAPAPDPSVATAKRELYALVQQLAEQFRATNHSIVCRELLGLDHPKDSPEPSVRTPQYYAKRPCVEYVADAAAIVGRCLMDDAVQLDSSSEQP